MKENLLWVRDFATIEELRLALLEFRRLYNEHWILERHGYLAPAQVRAKLTTRQAQGSVNTLNQLSKEPRPIHFLHEGPLPFTEKYIKAISEAFPAIYVVVLEHTTRRMKPKMHTDKG